MLHSGALWQKSIRRNVNYCNGPMTREKKGGDSEWKYSTCKCVRNGRKGRSKRGKIKEGQNMKNTYMYLRAQLFVGYKFHLYKFCGLCTKQYCQACFWHKIIWVGQDCSPLEVLQQHHLEKHSMATCTSTTPIGVYSCPTH